MQEGGGLYVRTGSVLLTDQTLLAGNRVVGADSSQASSSRGETFFAVGGEVQYQLPAPPGRWIAGTLCTVLRASCPHDENGQCTSDECRRCRSSRKSCSENTNSSASECQEVTVSSLATGIRTARGRDRAGLPPGGQGIDEEFPYAALPACKAPPRPSPSPSPARGAPALEPANISRIELGSSASEMHQGPLLSGGDHDANPVCTGDLLRPCGCRARGRLPRLSAGALVPLCRPFACARGFCRTAMLVRGQPQRLPSVPGWCEHPRPSGGRGHGLRH